MKQRSRTENSIINSAMSIVTQVLTVVLNFAVKTVFIKMLNDEYLGVNGLFTNIITMLSLADLGIGIAIPYSLYKPLANKDEHKINVLMNFYKKVYTIIGIAVLLIGLSLTPFLGLIIKDIPKNVPHLSLIYILFVIHSASSYFFVYKKFLIDSDQKGYITSRIIFTFSTLLSIIQIILLVTTKNYILFLLSSIILVIIQNIYISSKANKLYPFIKNKTDEKLEKEDMEGIRKNVSSLFIYKVGTVIMNGTDNIIISKFIGLIIVGFYSNYVLIINSITTVLNQIFNAITSSIGNLVVTTNKKRSKEVYDNLNFANFWLYALFGVCIIVLINPFINIWIGKKYVMGFSIVFLLVLNFYVLGMQSVTNSFRNAYGLFWIAKYRPIIMVIINIVISVVLVQFIGIEGVLIGTLISRLLTTAWLDPYIVHKYGFEISPKSYYVDYLKYLVIFIAISIILNYFVSMITINNIFILILIAILVVISVNVILVLLFFKTSEFNYFYDKIKKIRH
jgi:O-antigen/teichoic acid export membrane protein